MLRLIACSVSPQLFDNVVSILHDKSLVYTFAASGASEEGGGEKRVAVSTQTPGAPPQATKTPKADDRPKVKADESDRKHAAEAKASLFQCSLAALRLLLRSRLRSQSAAADAATVAEVRVDSAVVLLNDGVAPHEAGDQRSASAACLQDLSRLLSAKQLAFQAAPSSSAGQQDMTFRRLLSRLVSVWNDLTSALAQAEASTSGAASTADPLAALPHDTLTVLVDTATLLLPACRADADGAALTATLSQLLAALMRHFPFARGDAASTAAAQLDLSIARCVAELSRPLAPTSTAAHRVGQVDSLLRQLSQSRRAVTTHLVAHYLAADGAVLRAAASRTAASALADGWSSSSSDCDSDGDGDGDSDGDSDGGDDGQPAAKAARVAGQRAEVRRRRRRADKLMGAALQTLAAVLRLSSGREDDADDADADDADADGDVRLEVLRALLPSDGAARRSSAPRVTLTLRLLAALSSARGGADFASLLRRCVRPPGSSVSTLSDEQWQLFASVLRSAIVRAEGDVDAALEALLRDAVGDLLAATAPGDEGVGEKRRRGEAATRSEPTAWPRLRGVLQGQLSLLSPRQSLRVLADDLAALLSDDSDAREQTLLSLLSSVASASDPPAAVRHVADAVFPLLTKRALTADAGDVQPTGALLAAAAQRSAAAANFAVALQKLAVLSGADDEGAAVAGRLLDLVAAPGAESPFVAVGGLSLSLALQPCLARLCPARAIDAESLASRSAAFIINTAGAAPDVHLRRLLCDAVSHHVLQLATADGQRLRRLWGAVLQSVVPPHRPLTADAAVTSLTIVREVVVSLSASSVGPAAAQAFALCAQILHEETTAFLKPILATAVGDLEAVANDLLCALGHLVVR